MGYPKAERLFVLVADVGLPVAELDIPLLGRGSRGRQVGPGHVGPRGAKIRHGAIGLVAAYAMY